MAAQKQTSGFTLLELMVVVGILGTLATLAATAVGPWTADARQQNAAYAVLRLARQTHDRAQRSGKAQQLSFVQADSGGLGVFRVRSAMSASCLKAIWQDEADETYDMATVNVGSSAPTVDDVDRQVIKAGALRGATAQAQLTICFEPSGRSYTEVPPEPMAIQADLVSFQIEREQNGTVTGTPRVLLFEPGGRARLQR